MTDRQFEDQVAAARKRVQAMDAVDGFADRYTGTIISALRAGLMHPDSGAAFEAYVMLEDRRAQGL